MLKSFYLNNFPSDELGYDIREGATFEGLLDVIQTKESVYDYIGVCDSVIRERLFSELAKQIGRDYSYIYNMWLDS